MSARPITVTCIAAMARNRRPGEWSNGCGFDFV
jgi:hypothetical protein